MASRPTAKLMPGGVPIQARLVACLFLALVVAFLTGAARYAAGARTPVWIDVVFIVSAALALSIGVALAGWRLTTSGRRALFELEDAERDAAHRRPDRDAE